MHILSSFRFIRLATVLPRRRVASSTPRPAPPRLEHEPTVAITSCLARGTHLPCARIDHLPLGRSPGRGVLRDQLDRAGERVRPVIMRVEREVHELLHKHRILDVPRVNELELPARIKRLQALDTRALGGPGMPDKLIRDRNARISYTIPETSSRLTNPIPRTLIWRSPNPCGRTRAGRVAGLRPESPSHSIM